jgi:hypothetical protein
MIRCISLFQLFFVIMNYFTYLLSDFQWHSFADHHSKTITIILIHRSIILFRFINEIQYAQIIFIFIIELIALK